MNENYESYTFDKRTGFSVYAAADVGTETRHILYVYVYTCINT